MKDAVKFRRFGTMLDCSRNAVMNVKSIRKWIDITSDLGYNTLMLYTEDTYEIDENPYFGYMRGRYSKKELKEINDYALSRGIELIPCIQTLAHLNGIVRWPAYKEHVDTADILLAGDDKVYELIEHMFSSVSECFTSHVINIGMDEAHLIGRGRYYDLHGDRDRSQILIDHLKRVAQIGKKYGFTITMWSDMFFRLAAGDYYVDNAQINEEIQKQIPENVQLIYWDYYSTDKNHYDNMIRIHQKMKGDIWFAGGLWSWMGFAPHNGYSIHAASAALKSCREHGIQDVFLTLWGDSGGECSKFALLPSLFFASELAKGNSDADKIKEMFKEKYGISFDDFMLLDLLGTPGGVSDRIVNPDKYLLYNDCFTGLLDSTVTGQENEQYNACAERLKTMGDNEEWGYLFKAAQALCEVMSIKAELGVNTRKIYAAKDRNALKDLITEYQELQKKLEVFYEAYRIQWFTENKPHGFDVQDIRLGGLAMRVRSCRERLQMLLDGEIDIIEELEEKQLDFSGNGEVFQKEAISCNNWPEIITANVMMW